MSEPKMTGREHWLAAEGLLAACDEQEHQAAADALSDLAKVHALLALAAPAYGFHQEARPVVADSPNIVKGKDEGPHRHVGGQGKRCTSCGAWPFDPIHEGPRIEESALVTFTYDTPPERVQGECNVPECDQHG